MVPQVRQLHSWKVTAKEAAEIQRALQPLVVLRPFMKRAHRIGGADVSYSKDSERLFAAIVIVDIDTMETVEAATEQGNISFPYVPGLLSFREIPIILKAWEKICCDPDVLILDGQGIAHPRGLGLATHAGVVLDFPTIGCAKTKLVGSYGVVGKKKGEFSYLYKYGRAIGAVVRTRDNANPLFVSPGYGTDIGSSIGIVVAACHRYRVPEPVRRAHLLANRARSQAQSIMKD